MKTASEVKYEIQAQLNFVSAVWYNCLITETKGVKMLYTGISPRSTAQITG
jgi:hypothetical protein